MHLIACYAALTVMRIRYAGEKMKKIIQGSIIILSSLIILGCSTVVQKANLSDDASYYWLGSSSGKTKTIYKITDEQVVLHVVFKPNFSLSPPSLTVDWIKPNNKIWLSRPVSTKYGNNSVLITSLPIKGNIPSTELGEWHVKLKKDGETLVEFPFIVEK